MKKVLFMIAMLAAGMTAGAQEGWSKMEQKADELTGEDGGCVYMYTIAQFGMFVVWDWEKPQFCLIARDAQFDTKVIDRYVGMEVLVGIYDDDGKLLEKFTMWLDKDRSHPNTVIRTRNAGFMSNPVGQKKKVNKIFKALRSDSGYVRIVAGRYNNSDFDMKIYPLDI